MILTPSVLLNDRGQYAAVKNKSWVSGQDIYWVDDLNQAYVFSTVEQLRDPYKSYAANNFVIELSAYEERKVFLGEKPE